MDKKKFIHIAIVMPDMEIGGVEKSLLSFIEMFKDRNVTISLLLFKRSGKLLANVPEWVKVVELTNAGMLESTRKKISNLLARYGFSHIYTLLKHLYHLIGTKVNVRKNNYDNYDVLIAYKDGSSTWFASSIPAKVKIAFFHTDFIRAGYNTTIEKKIYDKYDRIYCVSFAARKSFVEALPSLAEKTFVFYAIINHKKLHDCAKDGLTFSDKFNGIRILTVARLSHEKGLDKAIRVLSMLKKDGYCVRWYIVGEGPEKNNLVKLIASYDLQDDFVLLGEIENPYRLMADCDIYVQPSNYEGYCLSLAEARALFCPIVTCNFAGAHEQIINRETGIITGMSVESLYEGVSELIRDNDLRERLKNNLKKSMCDKNDKHFDELFNFITCKLSS